MSMGFSWRIATASAKALGQPGLRRAQPPPDTVRCLRHLECVPKPQMSHVEVHWLLSGVKLTDLNNYTQDYPGPKNITSVWGCPVHSEAFMEKKKNNFGPTYFSFCFVLRQGVTM